MVLLVAAPAEHIKAVKAGLVAQDCSEINSALSSLVTWLTTVEACSIGQTAFTIASCLLAHNAFSCKPCQIGFSLFRINVFIPDPLPDSGVSTLI